MKVFFTNEKTNEQTDLARLLTDNSVEFNSVSDLNTLADKIGDAKYVLLGEASHGTHEYYTVRAKISKLLIEQKGFSFIAVEGDWPDCYRLNRYIKNYKDSGKNAYDAVQNFNRWPTWMWANWEIISFAEWLKDHNEKLPVNKKVGFYGLDVYSLWESLEAIISYLEKTDPQAKQKAINAFRCLEPYSAEEGQSYAHATLMVPSLCENEVVDLLTQIRKNMVNYNTDHEAVMSAEQNAQVIVNAQQYYHAMVRSGTDSWNIRDHHMTDTLNRIMNFYGKEAKTIIWEHNTHIGDARATDMSLNGMVNVGQLINEQHHKDGVYSIGFGSYKGTVIAGREWGDVMRIMNVPEAMAGSWEHLIHQLNAKDRIIFLNEEMKKFLGKRKFGHRAIGVVYHPEREHLGNYVPSAMPYRYNAFIYIDKTRALHPVHIRPDGHQTPETFPFGI
jgi:erythromycin esterase